MSNAEPQKSSQGQYFVDPKVFQELLDRPHFNAIKQARSHIERDDHQFGFWMFFPKSLQTTKMR